VEIVRISAIVWDLDGTLIHFKINSIRARRIVIKYLKEEAGIPKEILSSKNTIFKTIQLTKDHLLSRGLNEKYINAIIKIANSKVIEIEREAAADATMMNGIDKVLEFAAGCGLKQAIFTFNTYENAKLSLTKVNLLHYFDIIVGRNNVSNLKPHPDHLQYICDQLNVNSTEIIVIGDSGRDIEAAINVGASSIGIKTPISRIFQDNFFNRADSIIFPDEIPSKLIKAIEKLL
jgi:phosphoglycolate phosphatase